MGLFITGSKKTVWILVLGALTKVIFDKIIYDDCKVLALSLKMGFFSAFKNL
jgi:hypothetical protein